MLKARRFIVAAILLCVLFVPSQGITASPVQPITIIMPGEGSILSSPIHLAADIRLNPGDFLRVTLTNGSNIPISRQLLLISSGDGSSTRFEADIPFEIPTETAKALLTIATVDSYHRLQSLRSIPLFLSNDGTVKIETPGTAEPWLTITEPEPLVTLSGGQISVRGTVIPITETPVIFELITDTGGVIGYFLLAVDSPGQEQVFDLQMAYDFITKARNVRLVVRQTNDNYSADTILDSVPLTLLP